MDYVKNNFNRKMAVLKIKLVDDSISFNYDSIITKKLSCLQYLLIKFGLTKAEWEAKNIKTDWIGFKYLEKISFDKLIPDTDESCMFENALLCLLYPCLKKDIDKIKSIDLFNKFIGIDKRKVLQ
jgi:hypothetical protein